MTKRIDQPHVCGYDDCEAKSEVSASLICWLCLAEVKTLPFGWETCSQECARIAALLSGLRDLADTIKGVQR